MPVQNEIALIVAANQKVVPVIIAYGRNLHPLRAAYVDQPIPVHSEQSASVTTYIYVSIVGIVYGVDDILRKIRHYRGLSQTRNPEVISAYPDGIERILVNAGN